MMLILISIFVASELFICCNCIIRFCMSYSCIFSFCKYCFSFNTLLALLHLWNVFLGFVCFFIAVLALIFAVLYFLTLVFTFPIKYISTLSLHFDWLLTRPPPEVSFCSRFKSLDAFRARSLKIQTLFLRPLSHNNTVQKFFWSQHRRPLLSAVVKTDTMFCFPADCQVLMCWLDCNNLLGKIRSNFYWAKGCTIHHCFEIGLAWKWLKIFDIAIFF